MGSPLARPDDPPLVRAQRGARPHRRLLDEVREGRSRVLVLRGDAGIGKTRLAARRDRAGRAGSAWPAAAPVESEAELAVRRRCTTCCGRSLPLLDALTRAAGRSALDGALALGAPVGEGDRFTVCAATLGLLAPAAEQAPLLVVMEDVQWLDARLGRGARLRRPAARRRPRRAC